MKEWIDIVNEEGIPTGEIRERSVIHAEGLPHRTAHVWLVKDINAEPKVLLQKRSMNKDSWPGCYDTSSAGHIPAGEEPLPSALRELKEELGVDADENSLTFIGNIKIRYDKEFRGKPFRDNEIVFVYMMETDVSADELVLQEEEVEAVKWFDLRFVIDAVQAGDERFCVPPQSLALLDAFLGNR